MVKLFRFRRGGGGETGDAGPSETESAAESAEERAALATALTAGTAASRRGSLGRLGGLFRRGGLSEEIWEELSEILIGADVGVPTTLALVARTRERAAAAGVRQADGLSALLRSELVALLEVEVEAEAPRQRGQLWGGEAPPAPPHVILVVGVNGAGKTSTIAKLAQAYRSEGRTVILGAADTFRAAAIEQLQIWGERLDVPVVAGAPGADPGAVAYDTLSAATARGLDVAIIDTAGRLQNKRQLMDELAKIHRVLGRLREGAPHEVLLVLDATTGQNGLSQARVFGEVSQVTGLCLAKLDGTSKGGIVFAIAEQLGLPVRFVGIGEGAGDLAPFEAGAFVDALLGGA